MKNVLVTANNYYKPNQERSIHSERAALDKLKRFRNRSKRLIKLTLVVLKVSTTGSCIGMSKPCVRCLHAMATIPQMYGYKINSVIYSNKEGGLTFTTLPRLLNEGSYMTKFDSDHNYKVKI